MDADNFKRILKEGEGLTVEFKRCGNGIQTDTYETVCAFLNRFGGDIFLGVSDNGSVIGIPDGSLQPCIKNFISIIHDENLFTPTAYLIPEVIEFDGKRVIHIHIPDGANVYRFKNVYYDRVNDSDVKALSNDHITSLYIRKQNIYTEQQVFPQLGLSDLRLDLVQKVRQLAVNNTPDHVWKGLDDESLLRSAQFWGYDRETGKSGLTAAAILLLGRNEAIQTFFPQYKTEALLRRVDSSRYDDREIIKENLFQSYFRLLEFGKRYLPDKFYLAGDQRVSLRDKILREIMVNVLIHREFSSAYPGRFIIEREKLTSENPNRAAHHGLLQPDNLQPVSKNPIIASFFRQIGLADELGTGIRTLFALVPLYSGPGKLPVLQEGDTFTTIVPLDDAYSFDKETVQSPGKTIQRTSETIQRLDGTIQRAPGTIQSPDRVTQTARKLTEIQSLILSCLERCPTATQSELAKKVPQASLGGVKYNLRKLQERGLLRRVGADFGGHWEVLGRESK